MEVSEERRMLRSHFLPSPAPSPSKSNLSPELLEQSAPHSVSLHDSSRCHRRRGWHQNQFPEPPESSDVSIPPCPVAGVSSHDPPVSCDSLRVQEDASNSSTTPTPMFPNLFYAQPEEWWRILHGRWGHSAPRSPEAASPDKPRKQPNPIQLKKQRRPEAPHLPSQERSWVQN